MGWTLDFKSDDRNLLPQLVELFVTAVDEPSGGITQINADLQIRPERFEVKGRSLYVSLRAAFLVLDAYGSSTEKRTKYGRRARAEFESRPVEVERGLKVAVKHEVAAEIIAKGSLSPLKQQLALEGKKSKGAERSTEVQVTEKENTDEVHYPVEELTADRWFVSEPDRGDLNSVYLSEASLCRLVHKKGANRVGGSLSVQVSRADINTEIISGNTFFGDNKKQLLRALIAQHLSELTPDPDAQVITFAASEFANED